MHPSWISLHDQTRWQHNNFKLVPNIIRYTYLQWTCINFPTPWFDINRVVAPVHKTQPTLHNFRAGKRLVFGILQQQNHHSSPTQVANLDRFVSFRSILVLLAELELEYYKNHIRVTGVRYFN